MNCLLVLAAVLACASASTYTFHGRYNGKCEKDGLYYRDNYSFIFCSNGNSYVQPCAPGTRNSGYDNFSYGGYYTHADFCDVNLVDFGYAASKTAYYTPKYEAPKYEAPKYEAPKYEEPKYEAPKYEEPKYEAPKYEAPKYAEGYQEFKNEEYNARPYNRYGYDRYNSYDRYDRRNYGSYGRRDYGYENQKY